MTPTTDPAPRPSTPFGESGAAGQASSQTPSQSTQIERFFALSTDLLASFSPDGRFLLLNSAWEDALGWTLVELEGRPMQDFIHPDDIEQTVALIQASRHRPAHFVNFTNRYRHKDGSWRWLLWSGRRDEQTWYASAKDITDRMWLERQALHDPLTKLPNRLLLMDRAHQAIARLRRSHGLVALLFIDLDRFKQVNDSLGHAVGDHLLISVAERLAAMLRDSDTVARLGGDEFVILAEDLDGDAEALAVAERVLHALEEPFLVGSAEVSMFASVGVSVSHDYQADPEDLLREADVAMYRAKGSGGHSLELFDENLRREVSARMELDKRLRHALPRKELDVVYQPLLPISGGNAIGCEALVRWHPHGHEPIQPSAFLSLAEESDLITQIGDWVLDTACAQAAAWHQKGEDLSIAVNIPARALTELDLGERIRAVLTRTGLPARSLCLEVTEAAIMRDRERARTSLEDVKQLGVRIALDNFGCGQSSLSLPIDLPFDVIKIDRTLVQHLEHNNQKRAMVLAMIALARETQLTVVAVGIETDQQRELVRELGCSLGQGFLLHQPSSPERLHLREAGPVRSHRSWHSLTRLRT
ncbi:MAG: putative bifunctional diguanylate cyclase/phosphodiesterase [Solirubrobacteraceae bacterium]